MRLTIIKLIGLTIFGFFSEVVYTFAQEPLLISDKKTYPVREHLLVFEADSVLEVQDIIPKFNQGEFSSMDISNPLNVGITFSKWWFYLPIRNELDIQNTVFLVAASQGAVLITLYEKVDGKFAPTDFSGNSIPASQKKLDTRLFSFELRLNPKEEKEYFLSVDTQGGNLYLPFYMDDPYDYWAYESSRATHYGFFIGIFGFAFLLSLFFWFKTRENIYASFTLFIFLSLFFILEEDGYAFWWIYGDSIPELAKVIIPLTGTLSMYFLLQIMLSFHNFTSQNFPILGGVKILQAILVFLGVMNLLLLRIPHSSEFRGALFVMSFIGIILGVIIALLGSIYKFIQGFQPAKLYLLSVSILLLGLLNYSLNSLSLTNFNIFYPNGIVVGITLKIIIMMFALAYRYHKIKLEREELLLTLAKEREAVTDRIMKTLGNERERLAKDLHDDLGGLMAILKLKISHLTSYPSSLQPKLMEAFELADRACDNLRAISHDLILEGREFQSLESMIDEIVIDYQEFHQLNFSSYYSNVPALSQVVKVTLFRMIKELLHNIVKHSKATQANLQLIYDDNFLQIMVEDNGVGFENLKASDGIGLTNIKSRVDFLKGDMHLDSNANGTTFIFQIPYPQEKVKDSK